MSIIDLKWSDLPLFCCIQLYFVHLKSPYVKSVRLQASEYIVLRWVDTVRGPNGKQCGS